MSNKIGRFEILSELSHTDLGCVYKASDPESGQTVALKAVRLEPLGELASAMVKSVLEEAETSKVLNSHNVAALYGASELEGQLCACMEYVQGNAIATMLARKEGFSIWDLQDIARQACQGLDHAHVRKVVHYSLEPAKIMVQWDGIVKILSFGVSNMGAHAAQASGTIPDVLHYMSPEQLRGETVDARSNLFSLGAILYEMVTERRAFNGDDADQVRQAILEATPVAVDQVNRKIHPGLSAVIMKALCKAPEERYQSGQDLVNDLEKCKESASKASVGNKPAASVAPKVEPNIAPKPAVAAAKISQPAAATKAAAAFAGARQSAESASPAVQGFSGETASMSSLAMEEVEVQAPKIHVDPMMDESKQPGAKGRSFSEISELPPLKEVYVEPEPSAPPVEESVPVAQAQAKAAVFRNAAPPKPKVQPREVAKKAVSEIKQTPPQLFLYSIAGAVAVILLVIAGIAYHIHSGEADDDSVPQSTPTASDSSSAPALSQQTAQAPAPAATQVTPPPPVEDTPDVSVTPKLDSKANARKKKKVPAAAPAIVAGQLNIESNPPGAQIQIDGQNTGFTPFNLAGLNPGHHTVTISKSGYATETRTVDVASGSRSVISVQLSSLMATLAANSSPAGAAVWMDGKDTGHVTPAQLAIDKPGNHTLVFKKQGYLEETASVNLQIGQTFHVAPTLRALGSTDEIRIGGGKFKKLFGGGGDSAGMGAVNVKTQPKGAQVAVNNRIVDKMSPVEFYLNPGNYVIDITASGFKSVHKIITVEKNGKVGIDENLDRD
ncbi:MAG: PEGA domain-containing protein [Acidobacteriia bacterium]|nr:PEGA domain-containing protein [Terriglobia bacterium]